MLRVCEMGSLFLTVGREKGLMIAYEKRIIDKKKVFSFYNYFYGQVAAGMGRIQVEEEQSLFLLPS